MSHSPSSTVASKKSETPSSTVASKKSETPSSTVASKKSETPSSTVASKKSETPSSTVASKKSETPSSTVASKKSETPSSTVASKKSETPSSTVANDKGDTIIKTINQIIQRISSTNPDTNPVQVQQILVQLARQTAQTSNEEQAIEEMRQISLQVTTYPFGSVSQSLANVAQLASSGNVAAIEKEIIQEKSSGKSISQSLVNIALQLACGESTNVNEHLRQAAQILANQAGIPTEKVESIIIQIALQIFHTQGKVVTAQSICQIANQVANNPNGIIAQTILQLVKQDTHDDGKSGATIQNVKEVFKSEQQRR